MLNAAVSHRHFSLGAGLRCSCKKPIVLTIKSGLAGLKGVILSSLLRVMFAALTPLFSWPLILVKLYYVPLHKASEIFFYKVSSVKADQHLLLSFKTLVLHS